MNLVDLIEKQGLKENVAEFRVGDTVRVHFKIVEGTKERIQIFEGLVIARRNGGIRETFTVRKISFGVGVERTFPIHSPRIDKIEVTRQGDVRRAKLYYIRDLTGKAATKVKEKRNVGGVQKKQEKSQEQRIAELAGNKAKATVKRTPAQKKSAEVAKAKASSTRVTSADKRKTARAEARKIASSAPAEELAKPQPEQPQTSTPEQPATE